MQNAEAYLKNKIQTAKFLGVSVGSLERLMRAGLPYVKVGGLIRFRPEDIAAYIEASRRIHTDGAGPPESAIKA